MKVKYKLKVKAREFFEEKHWVNILTLEAWNNNGIPIQVLDEVENVYIDYGQKLGENSQSLKGWSSENGGKSHFQFTIYVQDITMRQHEKISIPELMDELQKTANKFFKYNL